MVRNTFGCLFSNSLKILLYLNGFLCFTFFTKHYSSMSLHLAMVYSFHSSVLFRYVYITPFIYSFSCQGAYTYTYVDIFLSLCVSAQVFFFASPVSEEFSPLV